MAGEVEDVRDGSPGSVTVDASSAVEVVARSFGRSPGPDQIEDANLDREINAPDAARVAVEQIRGQRKWSGHGARFRGRVGYSSSVRGSHSSKCM